MKKIIVTGGAGFIGSNFIHFIIKNTNDLKVINIDSLTYAGNLENLAEIENNYSDRYEFLKVDICEENVINSIIKKEQPKYIVNFAAESHVDRSIKNPNIFVKTNVLGTANLLNAAKDNLNSNDFRFLQVSTDEVYGTLPEDKTDIKFTEDTPLDPHSPYSASKASADLLAKSYYDTFGFPVLITRCSNNYGPYQFPEKLIPLMINNALSDKAMPVYGDGKNIRDWLYVEDHCDAIWNVLTKGNLGEVYNIGGNNEIQNINIVKMILDELKKPHSLITYVKDRLGHDRRYAIDATKIKQELGWEPKYKFEEKLPETISWYINNHKWVKNIVSGEYKKYYSEMYDNR